MRKHQPATLEFFLYELGRKHYYTDPPDQLDSLSWLPDKRLRL